MLEGFGREIKVNDAMCCHMAKQWRRGGGVGEEWEKKKQEELQNKQMVIDGVRKIMDMTPVMGEMNLWNGMVMKSWSWWWDRDGSKHSWSIGCSRRWRK